MDYSIHSLFPIPVLETTLKVSQEVIDYVNSLEYIRTHCNNSDISNSKNVLDDPIFEEYSKQIDSLVKNFVFEVSKFDEDNVALERVSSWVNMHHYSDWAQEHFHSNSFISGVWYLQTPENCGDLCMHSPHIAFGLPIDYSKVENNEYNSHTWIFSSSKDTLYIFPSTLKHSVFRNESEDTRISVAFNYYARGVLKTEDVLIYS